MSEFLTFLNTADLDTLTKVSGVTRPIAGNLIAARPFDSVDDCLKVHGMGKGLLARLQSFAEGQENEAENRAMVPVEEEALPVVIEKDQPAQENVTEKPSFWSRLGRAFVNFLRALIRLILTVAIIVGIGAMLYYGLPYINRTFIAPVERNTAKIDSLESEIATLQSELSDLNTRMDAIETSIESHTASIEKLSGMQTSLETQLKENNDKALLELKHEVMTTRALDMLGRARLYLAQSNFGLAKEDIQSARDLLADLQSETNDDTLKQVIERLDLALGNLPAFPVIAAGDLEIAWQILITGNAAVIPTATITPTPAAVETATPTPLPPPTIETTPTP